MKIVHIESGLGNQMLSYCEYLAIKKMNPNDDVYIETVIYDIPECNDVISQWYGYELDRIFGIKAPNIKDIMTEKQWGQFVLEVKESEFWSKNWNWPVYITKAFQKIGVDVENWRGDFEAAGASKLTSKWRWYKNNIFYAYYRRMIEKKHEKRNLASCGKEDKMFVKTDRSILIGQQLGFRFKNSGIERIDNEIRQSFVFPNITDTKNKETLRIIQNCNAVAVHIRRGDGISFNYSYLMTGYYKRSVQFIKKNVSDPVFFIFCDPSSIEWCKHNGRILGLNMKKDKVQYVDWNQGQDSWRDMQLMAQCKHNITSNSSFSWWGAYLNENLNKITISPKVTINTKYHF